MSARRSVAAKTIRKLTAPRCRMCKSTDVEASHYVDAVLFICKRCSFPWRVKHG